MEIKDLDEGAHKFLAELYRLSKGNTGYSVSMYQVGNDLGLDREAASKTAELLMGNNFVEIKTLSGGIGITADAVSAMKEIEETEGSGQPGIPALTKALLIDSASRTSIETVLTHIKYHIQEAGLDFDGITGVVIDVKTIETQLTSPAPKTAIIRECFFSLKSWLENTSHTLLKEHIRSILGK
jgi:hypothetical protein